MRAVLDDMERLLADLLQSGLSTGGPAALPRLRRLSARCEDVGLHTGGALLAQLEEALAARGRTLAKDDVAVTGLLCRTARYAALCREKLQEEAIRTRWQSMVPEAQEDAHAGGA